MIPKGIPIDGIVSRGCFLRRSGSGWVISRGGKVWTGEGWSIWAQDEKVIEPQLVQEELKKAVER